MPDLTNPRVIKLKGTLFLILGLLASTLLLIKAPSPRIAVLLVIAVWSFCRFYYCAFYVMRKLILLANHLLKYPNFALAQ